MDVDLGMLAIRLALGLTLLVHGYNKLFGAGGIDGTTRWFESLGLRPAWVHARLAAAAELVVGSLACAGLLDGFVAAAIVGLMTVAAFTDHRGKGYFVFNGGVEYTLLIAAVAVGFASVGSGRWSIDNLVGLHTSGPLWAVCSAFGGVCAATALLTACFRPAPSAEHLSERTE